MGTYYSKPIAPPSTSFHIAFREVPSEPRHNISILSSKVAESLFLLPEDVDDGVGRFAFYKLG